MSYSTEPGPPGWTPTMAEELIKAWDRGVHSLAVLKQRLDHFYLLEPDSYTVEFLRAVLGRRGRKA
ncbi:hypothetical protein MMC16_004639 [Acarospora aff. strigata]|nr:hypothetical protein [Acarospora aff. strigata]